MNNKPAQRHNVSNSKGKKVKVRSKLETQIADILSSAKVDWDYEVTKIKYEVPRSDHTYTVDFTVNGKLLIEGKGYLSDHVERTKYILIKQQHPEIDLRFVFANPNKLCGGMKTTHAEWADKHGFLWCGVTDLDTIKEWLQESGV